MPIESCAKPALSFTNLGANLPLFRGEERARIFFHHVLRREIRQGKSKVVVT